MTMVIQVVSDPGSVGYISHVHLAYDYLGPFGVLWVHMAWHKNCVKKNDYEKPQGFETVTHHIAHLILKVWAGQLSQQSHRSST